MSQNDVLAAANYLIDRYQRVTKGEVVRDLDEATVAYQSALERLEEGPSAKDRFVDQLEARLPTKGAGVPADLSRRRKKDRKAILEAFAAATDQS